MTEIPLFPLPLVLFPLGRLPLQIFEVRYLDMVSQCLKNDTGFGVVMIEEGNQVLQDQGQKEAGASQPSIASSGTYSVIVDFDQNENGTLGIIAEGRKQFVIRDQYETSDRLMMARVEFLEMEPPVVLPDNSRHLADLLENFVEHEAVRELNLEIDFEDAREVGWRLTELLPCSNLVKQKLFDMKNPLGRLSELNRLLVELSS